MCTEMELEEILACPQSANKNDTVDVQRRPEQFQGIRLISVHDGSIEAVLFGSWSTEVLEFWVVCL